jgi:spermidine/putrescine transport system substrate-binding protein
MEVAHMWTGEAVLAADPESGGREGIVYIIPAEGATIFQDALAVPASAPHKYTAMVFINFLADAQNAAQNTLVVGYPTTNQAAREFIDADILSDESAYPPDAVFERLHPIEDVGDAIELYDRIWTEFKAAIGG